MSIKVNPYTRTTYDALDRIGITLREHLYTGKSAPGGQKPVSHERPLDRERLARALKTTYSTLAQILTGRQRLTARQWYTLMNGGNQGQNKPLLPFTPDELAALKADWAVLEADRTSYKAEPARNVVLRWLGWIEEGDQLSLNMLKAEMVEKFKHLRQPSL